MENDIENIKKDIENADLTRIKIILSCIKVSWQEALYENMPKERENYVKLYVLAREKKFLLLKK